MSTSRKPIHRTSSPLKILGVAVASLFLLRLSFPAVSRRQSFLSRAFTTVTHAIDTRFGWYRLPLPLGLVVLLGERILLRHRNLYDTSTAPTIPQPQPSVQGTAHLTSRTADGTFNDLTYPSMGSAGTRFGRNVPLEDTQPDSANAILSPNPRTVSLKLLTRDQFVPATTINVLTAAWIQFMIRDWFSHGTSPKDNPWLVPLADDDPWADHPMRIMRTMDDPTRPPGAAGPPTHINTETHWWDGSQLYGSNQLTQDAVRTHRDGKLILTLDGMLSPPLLEQLVAHPGWWVGLDMMYTLFVREHNAICDSFRIEFPSWTDDEIFNHARLVNAALMAKIHTVEWTPAIISHPTTRFALRANWWGLEGERLSNIFGRIGHDEELSGIPGSPTNHHTAPYSLTEEFVAVYRMHPLIPDDFRFRASSDDRLLEERRFDEITDIHAQELIGRVSLNDLFYSFGTSYPGAVTLHNYPKFLQHFRRPDGNFMDLAAVDVLRMRELGVPRYNEFRRLFGLKPVSRFEQLTDNPGWVEELREIYDDDVERVDLMIGLFAEPKPQGFGFSDTAFRVFILMASRRLKSDRFLTTDFTPRVYTDHGIRWIADNDMGTVLLRHFPQLAPALSHVTNAFTPWKVASLAS